MNGMVATAPRAAEQQDRRAALRSAAYVAIKAELLEAIDAGDSTARLQRTPGTHHTLGTVMADYFDADERMSELVRLLRDAMRGEDVQLRAALLLSVMAERHARWHEADAADEADESLD